MCKTDCGRCLGFIIFLIIMIIFKVLAAISLSRERDLYLAAETGPIVQETEQFISSDKKVIYVASDEGVTIARDYILRNPSIPVEKIVFRKPGHNSTLDIFPVPRDALRARNHDSGKTELPVVGVIIVCLLVGIYLLICKYLFGCSCSKCNEIISREFDLEKALADFKNLDALYFGSQIKPKKDEKTDELNNINKEELKSVIIV